MPNTTDLVQSYIFFALFILVALIIWHPFRIKRYWDESYGFMDSGKLLEACTRDRIRDLFHILAASSVITCGPKGDTAETDVAFATRAGIFCIECKYRAGYTSGTEEAEKWETKHYGKIVELYSPIKQNDQHIKSLRYFLSQVQQQTGKGPQRDIMTLPIYNIIVFKSDSKKGFSLNYKTIKRDKFVRSKKRPDLFVMHDVGGLWRMRFLPKAISKKEAGWYNAQLRAFEGTTTEMEQHIQEVNDKVNNYRGKPTWD